MSERTFADHSISRKVIKNTAFNIMGKIWHSLVALLLTPFILHRIGVERYGILVVLGAITGYTGLFDIGVGTSLGRFIAEFQASRSEKKIGEVIGVGVVFYGLIGIIITVLVFVFLEPLMAIFKIPPYFYQEASVVFLMGIMLSAASNTFSSFQAVQVGLQRMDITNKIAISVSLVYICGAVFVLQKGFGLQGLMMSNLVVCSLTIAANVIAAAMLLPGIIGRDITFSVAMFKQIFNFGYRMQIVRFANVVSTQIDKLLVASLVSLGLATFYQLGLSIVLCVVAFSIIITSPLVPAFTHISVSEQKEALVIAYLKSTKYVTFLIVPFFLFAIFSASRIMTVWMSHPNVESARVIQILAPGWMVYAISQVASSLCMAVNKPQLMAKGAVITVVLNIVLSLVLIKLFGFLGAAWGNMIAVSVGAAYFVLSLHRILRVTFRSVVNVVLPCIFISLISVLLVRLSAHIAPWDIPDASRGWQFLVICAQGVLFMGSYIALILLCKCFSAEEFTYLKKVLLPAKFWHENTRV